MITKIETNSSAATASNPQGNDKMKSELKADEKVADTGPSTDATTVAAQENVNITGRSVFAVETTAAGVAVRTAFLTEDNRLLNMPAVFPDVTYATNVIDDLRLQVMQHFSRAAQVGARVIASQANAQQAAALEQQQQAGDKTAEAPKA